MVTVVSQIMGVPTGEGVQLVTGPMYHATPGSLATLGLHMGHTLVLMDKWEPQRTLELVERYRVSYMHMVPTMFQRLLALPEEVKRSYDTSSLRCVVHGAAPCPKDVKMRMIDWFGPIINEYYGSSEGGGASVGAEDWLKRPGTVGLPWPGAAIRIYDENGWQCPPEPGPARCTSRCRASNLNTTTHRRRRGTAPETASSRWATSATSTRTAICSSPDGLPN